MTTPFAIRRLSADDADAFAAMLNLFAEVFGDPETYAARPPPAPYVEGLLDAETFVALVAEADRQIVGGLAGYVLPKFEQARSEVFVYDLGVAADHRRQGVATALLEALKPVARRAGAHCIWVMADIEDDAPVAVYSRLGRRLDAAHFTIDVE